MSTRGLLTQAAGAAVRCLFQQKQVTSPRPSVSAEPLEGRLLLARIEGLNVSHWQGTIDWAQVANAGYEFAWQKATDDVDYVDPTMDTNMAGGQGEGLLMGVYHRARPDAWAGDAVAEANWFLNNAAQHLTTGNLPPMLDIEEGGAELGKAGLTQWITDFNETVRDAIGVAPVIYASTNYVNQYFDASLTDYDLWVANWSTYTGDPLTTGQPPSDVWTQDGKTWDVWQWSGGITVPGITANVVNPNVYQHGRQALEDWLLDFDNFLEVNINFGPTGTAVPPGYVNLGGELFGSHAGYNMGWNRSGVDAYDRNSPNAQDERYDTYVRPNEWSGQTGTFEIEVPSGSYEVTVVAGSPDEVGATTQFDVEGMSVINGVTHTGTEHLTGTITVEVLDGRLTISSPGGANSRLAFVEIAQVDDSTGGVRNVAGTFNAANPTITASNLPAHSMASVFYTLDLDAYAGDPAESVPMEFTFGHEASTLSFNVADHLDDASTWTQGRGWSARDAVVTYGGTPFRSNYQYYDPTRQALTLPGPSDWPNQPTNEPLRWIRFNNNYDEGNFDANGNPVTDAEPNASTSNLFGGHRLADRTSQPDDTDLIFLNLDLELPPYLDGTMRDKAIWSINFTSALRVWQFWGDENNTEGWPVHPVRKFAHWGEVLNGDVSEPELLDLLERPYLFAVEGVEIPVDDAEQLIQMTMSSVIYGDSPMQPNSEQDPITINHPFRVFDADLDPDFDGDGTFSNEDLDPADSEYQEDGASLVADDLALRLTYDGIDASALSNARISFVVPDGMTLTRDDNGTVLDSTRSYPLGTFNDRLTLDSDASDAAGDLVMRVTLGSNGRQPAIITERLSVIPSSNSGGGNPPASLDIDIFEDLDGDGVHDNSAAAESAEALFPAPLAGPNSGEWTRLVITGVDATDSSVTFTYDNSVYTVALSDNGGGAIASGTPIVPSNIETNSAGEHFVYAQLIDHASESSIGAVLQLMLQQASGSSQSATVFAQGVANTDGSRCDCATDNIADPIPNAIRNGANRFATRFANLVTMLNARGILCRYAGMLSALALFEQMTGSEITLTADDTRPPSYESSEFFGNTRYEMKLPSRMINGTNDLVLPNQPIRFGDAADVLHELWHYYFEVVIEPDGADKQYFETAAQAYGGGTGPGLAGTITPEQRLAVLEEAAGTTITVWTQAGLIQQSTGKPPFPQNDPRSAGYIPGIPEAQQNDNVKITPTHWRTVRYLLRFGTAGNVPLQQVEASDECNWPLHS